MPRLDKHATQGLGGALAALLVLFFLFREVFFTLHFLELVIIVAILMPHFFHLEEWTNKKGFQMVLVLSILMTILSLALTFSDQFFFRQHLFESLFYVAIVLLIFFRLEEWGYSLAVMTSLFWVLVAFLIGRLGDDTGIQLFDGLMYRSGAESFLSSVMFVGAIAMFAAGAKAYKRVIWGTKGDVMRLAITFVVVWASYSAMAYLTYQSLIAPSAP